MSRLDRTNSPHHVYRCFDHEGRLVYVGSSANLFGRLEQHRRSSWWASQVAQVTAKVYPNGVIARRYEREAIAAEHPRWNKSGRWNTRHDWSIGQWDDWLTMLLNRKSHINELNRFVGLYGATWGRSPSPDSLARVAAVESQWRVTRSNMQKQLAEQRRRLDEVQRIDARDLAIEMKQRGDLGLPSDCICTLEEFAAGTFCPECDAHARLVLDQGVL